MLTQGNREDVIKCVCVTAGFNADTLPVYAKRSQRMVITARKYTLCSPLDVNGSLTFYIHSNMITEKPPSLRGCELFVFVFYEFKLLWRTPLWLPKHWQLDRSARIRRTSPATFQSSLTLTPISKHPWVKTSLGLYKENKPWNNIIFLTTNYLWLFCILRWNIMMEPWVSILQSGLHYVCTDKILKVKYVMCVVFSALRRSESPCQTTKWWERRQQVRGETWSERSHASWPRPERLRASSKTTSLPSHVSLFLQRASVFQKSVLMCRLHLQVLFYVYMCVCMKACCIYMSSDPCVVSDCSATKLHPISQCPPALRAGIAGSGGDGLLWAGRPDGQREHSRKHHLCKSSLLELAYLFSYWSVFSDLLDFITLLLLPEIILLVL